MPRTQTMPDGSQVILDDNGQIMSQIPAAQVPAATAVPDFSSVNLTPYQKDSPKDIAAAFGKFEPGNAINSLGGATPYIPPQLPQDPAVAQAFGKNAPGNAINFIGTMPEGPGGKQDAIKPKVETAPSQGQGQLPDFTQTVTSTTLGKDTRALDQAYKGLDETLTKEGALNARAAEKQAELDDNAQKDIGLFNERLQGTIGEGQKKVAGKQAEFDQAAKEQAGYLFDQNRFFKRMTTGNQILAGIGVLLGGIASGFDGKENKAFKAINDAIDRDIAQQKMEYEKLKDKSQAAQTGYSMVRQMTSDEKEAAKLTRDLAVEQTLAQAKIDFTKQFGPERAEIETEKLRQKLNVDRETGNLAKQGTTTIQKTKDPVAVAKALKAGDQKVEIPKEKAQAIGYLDTTLDGINQMRAAIQAGDNRWSPIGDNAFTLGLTQAAENYGRHQSGGVISPDEEKRFNARFRGAETKEAALQRLNQVEKEILTKRQLYTAGTNAPPPPVSQQVKGAGDQLTGR